MHDPLSGHMVGRIPIPNGLHVTGSGHAGRVRYRAGVMGTVGNVGKYNVRKVPPAFVTGTNGRNQNSNVWQKVAVHRSP